LILKVKNPDIDFDSILVAEYSTPLPKYYTIHPYAVL